MLKDILEQKKLTPYQLWKMTDLSRQTIYNLLEKDLRLVTYKQLEQIAKPLQMSVEQLVEGETDTQLEKKIRLLSEPDREVIEYMIDRLLAQ